MTEIKPWQERVKPWMLHNTGANQSAMQDEIDELRARLAQQAAMVEKFMVAMNENADRGMKAEKERDELRAALKQVEPVAWQYRTRPDWEKDWQQSWMYCSKETFKDYTRAPLIHDWHYEVRELFTHPAREPVLGTKTWMEGGVVMTQNLTASDIYKPVPMTDAQKRDALAAQRGEPWEQSFMLGIKAAEAFHGIKGATS